MQRNFVNAGGLFMFSGAVPQDFVDDALASNLFYQLAVSADPFTDTEAWQQEHIALMVGFGQEITRTDVESIPLEGPDSLWNVIKTALGKRVSPELLSQAETAFTHLHNGDGAALKLLEQYSTQPLSGGEHESPSEKTCLAVVTNDQSRPPRAVVLQLVFVDRQPFLTQVFLSFQTCSPSPILPLIPQEQVVGNLELNLITTDLDADTYAEIKETVLQRLGTRRASLTIELPEVES